MPNPKHTRNNKTKVADRRIKVYELRLKGYTMAAIAEQLGVSYTTVLKDERKEITNRLQPLVEEQVKKELDKLDMLEVASWNVLEKKHVAFNQKGYVVDPEGKPITDDKIVLDAVATILKIADRRAKLLGLDQATKTEQKVVVEDQFTSEYQKLLAQQEERNIQRLKERNAHPSANQE